MHFARTSVSKESDSHDEDLSGLGLNYSEIQAVRQGQIDHVLSAVRRRNRRLLIVSSLLAVVLLVGIAMALRGDPPDYVSAVVYSSCLFGWYLARRFAKKREERLQAIKAQRH